MSERKTFKATITYTVDGKALGITPSVKDEREAIRVVTERDQLFTELGVKVKRTSVVEVKK